MLSVSRFRRSQLRLLTLGVVFGAKRALEPGFSGENPGRPGGNDLAGPGGGAGAPPSVRHASIFSTSLHSAPAQAAHRAGQPASIRTAEPPRS